MQYQTLLQIRTKIETDLDLLDELFITQSEMNAYINEAINDVEADVHTLYEDYFLTSANIALNLGQSEYSLPTNIYAMKIRRIVYQNGSNGATIYEMVKLKDRDGFMEAVILDLYPTLNYYKYRIVNRSATAGPAIQIHPPAQETSTTNVTCHYIREANTLVNDTDLCDIPEFVDYVIQFAKCRCYEKEPGHPNYPTSLAERERLKELMRQTLKTMIIDADNFLELDNTFYEDMV